MFEKFPIGRYILGQSFFHRLDPRYKIVSTLLYFIFIFLTDSITIMAVHATAALVAIGVSRLPVAYLWQGMKGLLLFLVIAGCIQLFGHRGEELIWSMGKLEIYSEGMRQAILLTSRFILLIIAASLLTLTTSAQDLSRGFEVLLRPLRPLGFPNEEFAFMITISVRFIPTLLEEIDHIVKAQTARGADFQDRSLIKRLKAFPSLWIPILSCMFRRAEHLAFAVESRCYRGGMGRTRHKPFQAGWRDGIVIFVILFLFVITSMS